LPGFREKNAIRRVSLKEKILVAIILIGIVALLCFIYRPLNIDTVYSGIYFDRNSSDLMEQQVNVSIVGIVKKNLLLQPESFAGTISINSSIFEFIEFLRFDKVEKTIRLTLNKDSMNTSWRFYDESGLFNHYDGEIYWSIYLDKKLSKITFVPFISNGKVNSSMRVAAPCDNREDALKLTQFLNSGGIE